MFILAQALTGNALLSCIVWFIVIAAAFAILYVALQKFGIEIPGWVIQIFWIVVVAFVAIIAIKFLWGFI